MVQLNPFLYTKLVSIKGRFKLYLTFFLCFNTCYPIQIFTLCSNVLVRDQKPPWNLFFDWSFQNKYHCIALEWNKMLLTLKSSQNPTYELIDRLILIQSHVSILQIWAGMSPCLKWNCIDMYWELNFNVSILEIDMCIQYCKSLGNVSHWKRPVVLKKKICWKGLDWW